MLSELYSEQSSLFELLFSFCFFTGLIRNTQNTKNNFIKNVCIQNFSGPYFPALNWTQRFTLYISIFSPNVGKYRPEKLRLRTLLTQSIPTIIQFNQFLPLFPLFISVLPNISFLSPVFPGIFYNNFREGILENTLVEWTYIFNFQSLSVTWSV